MVKRNKTENAFLMSIITFHRPL